MDDALQLHAVTINLSQSVVRLPSLLLLQPFLGSQLTKIGTVNHVLAGCLGCNELQYINQHKRVVFVILILSLPLVSAPYVFRISLLIIVVFPSLSLILL